ncbi:MAG: TlpA family protein disulfide reductase [Chitinophagaceae bacterium]|nr:MAG: TlpA family protein disulfide reductase [Chitinophagaceae bacterium]
MRRTIVFAWLTILFTTIVGFFWYNDLVYRLPTPVPPNYSPVLTGSIVAVPGRPNNQGKPVFLHFFNPDCPCSRFNIKHVRALIKEYGEKADFKVVLVTTKDYSPAEIRERFELDVPVIIDSNLAPAYGVYSTPQAVIINSNNQLYYRGNYNRSRYCTDKKTNYAEIAISNLLKNRSAGEFESFALKSYGCELPDCTKP